MGKIKGWTKIQDNKYGFKYISKTGSIYGYPPHSILNELENNWKVSAWSKGVHTYNNFAPTKAQAKELAMRYMKAHPRG